MERCLHVRYPCIAAHVFSCVTSMPRKVEAACTATLSTLVFLLGLTCLTEQSAASMRPDGLEADRCFTTVCHEATSTLRQLAASNPPALSQGGARPEGAWRLMRAPNPYGGPDAVSIVHTVDFARSDADLAGIMLRCAARGLETLAIVFDPRPPSSRPWVKVSLSGAEKTFEAKVVPPFTALLLPAEATSLLTGGWRTSDELAIEVEAEPAPVKGILSLAGLGPALEELRASCPAQ